MKFSNTKRCRQPAVRSCWWLLLGLCLFACGPALALSSVSANGASTVAIAVPTELTTESVDQFVSGLSDESVRQVLREELNLNAARKADLSAQPDNGMVEFFREAFSHVGKRISRAVQELPHLFDSVSTAAKNYVAGRSLAQMAMVTLSWLMVIGIAAFAELGVRWLTRGWQANISSLDGRNLWQTIQTLGSRFFLEILGVLVFVAVCRLVAPYLITAEPDRQLFALFIVSVVMVARVMAAIARFLLAPQRADLRLLTIDDDWAKYLQRRITVVGVLIGQLTFVVTALFYNGIAPRALMIGFWLNAILYVYVIYLLWYARAAVTEMLIGGDDRLSSGETRLMTWWPWIAILMVVANWMLIENIVSRQRFDLLHGQQTLTLLLIIMTPVLGTMIRSLVHHLTPPMRGEGPVAEHAYHETKRGFVRIGRVLVFVILFITIARMWGVNLRDIAAKGVGRQFSERLIEALVLLAIGYLVYEIVKLLMNRVLAREQTVASYDFESTEARERTSRLGSVLPLIQKVVLATIAVLTALMVLGQLGVDTTPLLAGAGIIGLAIGFGAQTLVRDIVSGLFFLTDDAFRLGEFIDIDGTLGKVEKISIRSIQLRHHLGAIHTIPYGEIPKVTNKSRDWVITKLKFTVPFDTDLKQVKKIFKQIGNEMMQVPEYADIMMQPFKLQGVYNVDDVGIVIRGKFMARPGTQFTLRKDIYMRVQQMFAANNIEFARREVYVRIPEFEDDKLKPASGTEGATTSTDKPPQA